MRSVGRIATISIMVAGQMLVAAAFAESPDGDRILCKSQAATGTRMPQPRICKTRAQWREIEKQAEFERHGEALSRELVTSNPSRPGSPQ